MKIFLIRHGYSIANSKKLVTGDKQDALASCEMDSVYELAEWLQKKCNLVFDRYYVSDWVRAQQTAKIVYPNAKWIEDSRLGETDAGSVKNLELQEFLKLNPKFYTDNSNCYPDGESHIELNERVLCWLNDLLAKKDIENVLVVSHSGPISCILQYACGIGMEAFPMFLPRNATISCIESTNNDSGQLELRLKTFSASPNLIFK